MWRYLGFRRWWMQQEEMGPGRVCLVPVFPWWCGRGPRYGLLVRESLRRLLLSMECEQRICQVSQERLTAFVTSSFPAVLGLPLFFFPEPGVSGTAAGGGGSDGPTEKAAGALGAALTADLRACFNGG